jgi:hypothetical protein
MRRWLNMAAPKHNSHLTFEFDPHQYNDIRLDDYEIELRPWYVTSGFKASLDAVMLKIVYRGDEMERFKFKDDIKNSNLYFRTNNNGNVEMPVTISVSVSPVGRKPGPLDTIERLEMKVDITDY